jgi:hypothetical protein
VTPTADDDTEFPNFRKPGLLAPLVFLAIGAAPIAYVPYHLAEQRQSESWVTADGEITQAALSISKTPPRTYSPRIEYMFEVDGREYTGSTLDYSGGPSSLDEIAVRKYLASFIEQNPLRVYYDPADPSRNCLVPGGEISWLVVGGATFFGLLFMAFGAMGMWTRVTHKDFIAKLRAASALQNNARSTVTSGRQ